MTNFGLDGFGETFRGVNCGQWNGWSCPIFTLEEGLRFMDYINAMDCGLVGKFEDNKFIFEDTNADFADEFGEVTREDVTGYAIGAFSWCWTIEEN